MRRILLLLLLLCFGDAAADTTNRRSSLGQCRYSASHIETQMRNLPLRGWFVFAGRLNAECGEEARVIVKAILRGVEALPHPTENAREIIARARQYLMLYGEPKLQHELTMRCPGARGWGNTSWAAWPPGQPRLAMAR